MTPDNSPFEFVFAYLVATAISITRPLAMFSLLPVFIRLGLPDFFRTVVIMVLSLRTITSLVGKTQAIESGSPLFIVFIGLKETLIGLLLGLIAGAPFWAIEMAGNILDFVRQAPDAETQDPLGTTQASITGTLFSIFATLLFLSAGGLTVILDILYKSYDIWPALDVMPELKAGAPFQILALLDSIMRISLLLAAPLFLFMVLSIIVLAIVARFVPQINVFDLSMAVRNAVFFSLIGIYIIYISTYFTDQFKGIKDSLDIMMQVLNGRQ